MLPVSYLRGLSTVDFAPALSEFFGSDTGLSATSIGRLLETWTDEYTAFESRDLSGSDFVHVWADGVHFRIRLEEDRLCCLVVIGVKADGTKELLAGSDGYRESTESWADVLRDLWDRGMTAPSTPPLEHWNAHSHRIRDHSPKPARRTADSSELTPPNPGQTRVSTIPRANQSPLNSGPGPGP